jgi:hypothetical protein
MARKPRNHAAEYAARIARGLSRGLSRSQARGHAKPLEPAAARRSSRPIADERLQLAFRVLRQERNLTAAAKAAKISPERLRRLATERQFLERRGRQWAVKRDLPRRMLLYSDGKERVVTVGDFDAASKIGRYMTAVSKFLRTNNPSALGEFVGESVRDTSGKTHVFETRRNPLYRLAHTGDRSFEQIYRIVI